MPEGGFAGGEQRVFTGVPAEEMGRAGVRGVVFAGFPDFVKEEGAGLIRAAVQVVLQAALFLTGGCYQRSKFGLKKQVLAFFGAHDHNQGDGVFGELDDGGSAGAAAFCGFTGFRLSHYGGDCTPKEAESKGDFLSRRSHAFARPAAFW